MQQRVGLGRGVEVVTRGGGDDEVRDEEHGPEAGLGGDLLGAERAEQHRREEHRHGEHEREGRGQALEPTHVEPQVADPPVRLDLSDQHGRDHVPGDDEEDVDTGEPTGNGKPRVVGHDREYGEGAQALHVAAACPPLGCAARGPDFGRRQISHDAPPGSSHPHEEPDYLAARDDSESIG